VAVRALCAQMRHRLIAIGPALSYDLLTATFWANITGHPPLLGTWDLVLIPYGTATDVFVKSQMQETLVECQSSERGVPGCGAHIC
jgi:hypothetical protein